MSCYAQTEGQKKVLQICQLRKCDSCTVRNGGICSVLDNSALDDFRKFSRRMFVKDGETIFHEGDESIYFYSVVFGVVKLSKTLVDGRQHIVDLLYPPVFIGERLESHHIYGAQAVSDVELCFYPRKAFEHFIKRHVELEHKVFEMAVRELDLCRERTLILARKNALERVATFLLMVLDRVPEVGLVKENAARIRLPLNRAEMADYLGLTLETVSRQLSLLKHRQIIELHSWRNVTVPSVRNLAEVAHIENHSKRRRRAAAPWQGFAEAAARP